METINIIAIDDHKVTGYGLEKVLKDNLFTLFAMNITTLLDAQNLEAIIEQKKANLLILDWDLGNGKNAEEIIIKLRKKHNSQDLKILIYTSYTTFMVVAKAFHKTKNSTEKANGILNKTHTDAELTEAIRQIWQGKLYFQEVYKDHYANLNSSDYNITSHQQETLIHLALGKKHKEIAILLKTSVDMIDRYADQLRTKTGTKTPSELILEAKNRGWI